MRESRKTLNEKKRLLKDADITIKNNCLTEIVLKSDKNGGSFIELMPGESEDVSFDDMTSIAKKHKLLFNNYSVLIDDVYAPNHDEVTVEDVERILNIRAMEHIDEVPDEYYFDDLLLDCSFEEYKSEVETLNHDILERMVERAVILHKEKRFSDSFKMQLLENKLQLEYVFEDVDRSLKDIKPDIETF